MKNEHLLEKVCVTVLDQASDRISNPRYWCRYYDTAPGGRVCATRAIEEFAENYSFPLQYKILDFIAVKMRQACKDLYEDCPNLMTVNDNLGRKSAVHAMQAVAAKLRSKL